MKDNVKVSKYFGDEYPIHKLLNPYSNFFGWGGRKFVHHTPCFTHMFFVVNKITVSVIRQSPAALLSPNWERHAGKEVILPHLNASTEVTRVHSYFVARTQGELKPKSKDLFLGLSTVDTRQYM